MSWKSEHSEGEAERRVSLNQALVSLAMVLPTVGFYAVLIWQMAHLWIVPQPDQNEVLVSFGVLMMFEFIMVHSRTMMAAAPNVVVILTLVVFYGVFTVIFNSSVPDNSIVWLYVGTVTSRLLSASWTRSPEIRGMSLYASMQAAIAYLVCVFAGIVGAGLIPELGLTPDMLDKIGYTTPGFPDVLEKHPHVPLAVGIVYFAILICYELRFWRESLRV